MGRALGLTTLNVGRRRLQAQGMQSAMRFIFKWCESDGQRDGCSLGLCTYSEAYRICRERRLLDGSLSAYEPTFRIALHERLPAPCSERHLRFAHTQICPMYYETRNRWGRVVTRVQARPQQCTRTFTTNTYTFTAGRTQRRQHYQPQPHTRKLDQNCVT
jgi:hypothetical protein